VGRAGLEPERTSASNVADCCEKDAKDATKDDPKQREVSASVPAVATRPDSADAVEAALAGALVQAAGAGRFDVVAQLARELEARRLSRAAMS